MARTRQTDHRYSEESITRNLRSILDQSTREDHEAGIEWYANAWTEAEAIGAAFEIPARRAAGVIAALSPMREWNHNLESARQAVDSFVLSGDVPFLHFADNVLKVQRILEGGEPLVELKGDKVLSFYRNITGQPDPVTVDRWIIRASLGHDAPAGITPRLYARIRYVVQGLAKEEGVEPRQLQAILWVTIKRLSEEAGDDIPF